MVGIVFRARHAGERRGEFRVVESGSARAFGDIDENEFAAIGGGDTIPEALIGQPVSANVGSENQGIDVAAERFFGTLVIGGGIDAGLGGKRRSETGERQYK